MEYSYQDIMEELLNCSEIQPGLSSEEPALPLEPGPETPPKPKLKIEKMERCLHGRSCRYLKSKPPARPMCDAAGLPVWDLEECPIMNWGRK